MSVLDEVTAEPTRQDERWGQQNHDPFHYLSILTEGVGECARACNEWWGRKPEHLAELREELVQTAAVAVAFVECLDPGEWEKPEPTP
jgi:NTP pyrophosphatase (non-canonical NTP hydrolase)